MRYLSNTKTNYWSKKVSEVKEDVLQQLKGDGIPFVRSLLPKHDHSMEVKYDISLVNYLIQNSKRRGWWRKSRFYSDHHLTPQIIFSKIDHERNQPVTTLKNKTSSTTRNCTTEQNTKNQIYSSLCFRNKRFPRTHYDHILNMYQLNLSTLFSKKK